MRHVYTAELSPETLRRSFFSNSASTYLTLISIIQGVAFALLMTNAADVIKRNGFAWPYLIYPFLSLTTIVLVLFSYHWYLCIISNPPRLTTAIIPFAVGISECVPLFVFDHPRLYLYAFSGYCVVGAAAYASTFWSINMTRFRKDCTFVPRLMKRSQIISISSCIAAGVVCFVSACTYGDVPHVNPVWQDVAVVLASIMCLTVISLYNHYCFLTPTYVQIGAYGDPASGRSCFMNYDFGIPNNRTMGPRGVEVVFRLPFNSSTQEVVQAPARAG